MKNEVEKVMVMHFPFVNSTMKDLMEKVVRPTVINEKSCFMITANPEIVMRAQKDKSYEQLLLQADYLVPDGVGIILAAKWQKTPLQSRIPGVELMDRMLYLANEKGLSCYFLGATEEVNQLAVKNIQDKYPRLVIAGAHHGYFDVEDHSIAEDVQKSSPDFIFVALGAPRQEAWIATHREKFSKGIFMGVGGSFDIYAKQVKRAPTIWIKLHLEWLYRLLQQPARWRRIGPLMAFAVRALLKK